MLGKVLEFDTEGLSDDAYIAFQMGVEFCLEALGVDWEWSEAHPENKTVRVQLSPKSQSSKKKGKKNG